MCMSVFASLYVCVPHVASIWQAAFQQNVWGRFRHVGAKMVPASKKQDLTSSQAFSQGFLFELGSGKSSV